MPFPNKLVNKYTLNTGTGTQTIESEFDALDLSWATRLTLRLAITAAATDAGDTLNVALQSTHDGVKWDDRIRCALITGDMSPTAAAPEYREYHILQEPSSLSLDEESGEPSGSAGGTALLAGEVRHGPFPRKRMGSSGPLPSWRLSIVVTEASTVNADFEGEITTYVGGA